ncbi:prolyl 4-hydroxylase subunit alpha-1 [Calliphora vicina]|uniref:prolyl 4-hydroxylase subunit alpha-1 n=1 Tax=Calliphora vicina TaxID=7373 RepID=UPI00325ABC24
MFRWLVIIATTLLALATLNTISTISYVNAEITSSPASSSSSLSIGQEQDELHEMLNTEKVLIDTLRHYIETQEHRLNFLKSKTNEIRNIHDGVTDREKYLYNPINALTILKRFTADWKSLKSYAEDYLKTEDLTKNYTQQIESLTFPTDEDYDAALINLLRIQDMYQLEPQRLAVGEVNGVKLGSEMTWSDCLEIGLKSSKNGYQTYAKYWMETALEKLPSNNNTNEATIQGHKKPLQDDYTVKAKLEIMTALLNTEYKLGNIQEALKIANEMLELQPKLKNVKKAKKQMEMELKKSKGSKKNNQSNKVEQKTDDKQKKKTTKTVEELMIEEICREASSLQNNKQIHTASSSASSWNPTFPLTPSACAVVTNNLPLLLMQPLNVELLSLDPYIVIYHNVLSDRQIEELKDFVVEGQDDTFQFTKIGQKKMRQMNGKLHYILGHYGQDLYDDWQVERYNFENLMELEKSSVNYENAKQSQLLFNLQQPLMGGAVIFPQLELSINLPRGSLLYFSKLNEFHAHDYRSNYHVCPVIGGSQITATTTIKNI